jgi:hypothetical protein
MRRWPDSSICFAQRLRSRRIGWQEAYRTMVVNGRGGCEQAERRQCHAPTATDEALVRRLGRKINEDFRAPMA